MSDQAFPKLALLFSREAAVELMKEGKGPSVAITDTGALAAFTHTTYATNVTPARWLGLIPAQCNNEAYPDSKVVGMVSHENFIVVGEDGKTVKGFESVSLRAANVRGNAMRPLFSTTRPSKATIISFGRRRPS